MTANSRTRRIGDLAETLASLGGKSRGMKLGADEWNALVGALSGLLAVVREQDDEGAQQLDLAYAKADHEHLGEVSLAWFEPALQAQQGGGQASLGARDAIVGLQAKLAQLQNDLGRLSASVDRLERTVDKGTADGIDLGRVIGRFDKRFAGIEDLKTAVDSIGQTQAGLAGKVDDVIKLRRSLADPAGNPIDVAGLVGRVAELKSFEAALTGIDGKALRLKDLQLQVLGLEDKVGQVAGTKLEPLIADLQGKLKASLAEEQATNLATVRAEILGTRGDLSTLLEARLKSGLDEVKAGSRALAIADLEATETRLRSTVTDGLRQSEATLQTSLRGTVSAGIESATATLDARIGRALDTRQPQIAATLRAEFAEKLNRDFAAAAAGIEGRVTVRLGAAESALAATFGTIDERIRSGVAGAIDGARTTLSDRLTAQTQELRQALDRTIADRLRTELTTGTDALRSGARDAVTEGLRDLDQRIATSVGFATAGFDARIAGAVDTKLAQTNVRALVDAANADLAIRLRSEIATTAAQIQANNANAIRALGTDVRSEIGELRTNRLSDRVVIGAGGFGRIPG